MYKEIFVETTRHILAENQLLQTGGEGAVYELGPQVVKLYHQTTPAHRAKLNAWLRSQRPLSDLIYQPQQLVTNQQGQTIGYVMRRLPAGSFPIKQLAQANFIKRQQITLDDTVLILQDAAQQLANLHQHGIVVGDLNDLNIYVTQTSDWHTHWIDTDSYQLEQHPCPVGMEPFLDPALYEVPNLAAGCHFSQESDWYAFNVLAFKCLLLLHPFGGVHRQLKSLMARVKAGITIFDSSVKRPRSARSTRILSPDLKTHFSDVFIGHARKPLDADRLERYKQSLGNCLVCGVRYSVGYHSCPQCRLKTAALNRRKVTVEQGFRCKLLLQDAGSIECLVVDGVTGRLRLITRKNEQLHYHKIGSGGSATQLPLFRTSSNDRYQLFGETLAVVRQVKRQQQIQLIDLSNGTPQPRNKLVTGMFQESAQIASSGGDLWRTTGGWLMRGAINHGTYVDSAVADIRPSQTQFWGSPLTGHLLGFYRIFDTVSLFKILPNGRYFSIETLDNDPPLVPDGQRITAIAPLFGRQEVGFVLTFADSRSRRQRLAIRTNETGHVTQRLTIPKAVAHPAHGILTRSSILLPTDDGLLAPSDGQLFPTNVVEHDSYLYPHPHGLLVNTDNELTLLSET